MIHIFIHALSASAGGGLTYVRNVVPRLALRDDVRATLLIGKTLRGEILESARVAIISESYPESSLSRFWYEQRSLPNIIRKSGADVLLSTGNFALFYSPVPQILLSRNALYTSTDFMKDVRERGDYRLWMDTKIKGALARRSIHSADCTVAPSETFARELQEWSGKNVRCVYHGFDSEMFFRDPAALPDAVRSQLSLSEDVIRVLFVSHYNYYRNFETLIRTISILKKNLHPRKVRLILTCKLISEENPGSYRADTAAELVRQLDLNEEVVELGSVPYGALHHLYRACDVYGTPAYAETFAHPLVEAMASGLPVVASDIGVHREICGQAALYFPRFSPEILAERIGQVCESAERKTAMREMGLLRSRDFSWDKHVEELLLLARQLVGAQRGAVA
jgi:glycosyltransferase involved in cell wall biosynthesis